jgi:hypothetical protein
MVNSFRRSLDFAPPNSNGLNVRTSSPYWFLFLLERPLAKVVRRELAAGFHLRAAFVAEFRAWTKLGLAL